MTSGMQFALLVDTAASDTAALKSLMALALGTGFMSRLARKELSKIGIQVDTNDSSAKAASVR